MTWAGRRNGSRRAAAFAACIVLAWAGRGWSANPSTIYVYPYGSQHGESLMASLSGVVARTSPEVFMAIQGSNPNHDPEFWLNKFVADNPGTSVVWQNSLPFYIEKYKSKLSGYVVYNNTTINEATSVAGALGAIMVHESLLPSINSSLVAAGLSQVEDVRGRDSTWVFNNYGSQFNKDMIFRQNNNLSFNVHLRSYAIMNKGFMFDNTGATRNTFLNAQNPNGRVFGWGYGGDEFEFFDSASDRNLMGVPADHLHGSAAPAKWEVDIPEQPHHTPVDAPTNPDKHYVAFVMSDGDNVQWLTNDFARSTRWFGSNYRGNFDFTFDLSPSLADVNPIAVKYLYDEAATDEHKTFFVTPGGQGLAYPSQVPDINGMMDATIPAMQAVDHNIISVLDDTLNLAKLNQMVARPEVMGMMLKTGNAYAGQNGNIFWSNGKPIVSVRHTLWEGVSTASGVNTVNEMITALNNAPRDALHNQASYTIVNVHPWSTSTEDGGLGDPMSNVNKIVGALGSGVEVVTLEELMIHLRNNFGAAVGTPVGQNLISNGDFEIPVAGNPSRPLNWNYAPATALVSGTDSAGEGTHAVAINAANSDWRSVNFDVEPGERLRLSFDFQFVGVPDGSGFRADARFFTESLSFVGESVEFLDAAEYAAGEWHTFEADITATAGGPVGDLRFSTYFGPFAGGQVLIDNVKLLSNLPLAGDYNGDDVVDAADYTIWRDSLGAEVTPFSGADGDGNGVVTNEDYAVWRTAFGASAGGGSSDGVHSVPEPRSVVLWIAFSTALAMFQRGVHLPIVLPPGVN
ncbi:MAG: hypothetical protein AB7G28_08960 [Pirellulales bacterium]